MIMRTKKIGIALSGGGINGIAHLELLKRLEFEGIKPISLTGSSAGAIIAMLYSDGGISRINQLFEELAAKNTFGKFKMFLGGFEKSFIGLENTLKSILKANNFEELPIPFACTATDLKTGQAVVLKEGLLVPAIMASSAVPGLFQPRLLKGKYLADGGIADGLPTKAARQLGANFIIGSILNNYKDIPIEKLQSFSRVKLLNRAINIIRHKEHAKLIASCDFCFNFPTADIPGYNFYSKDVSIRRAKEVLDKQMPELLKALNY